MSNIASYHSQLTIDQDTCIERIDLRFIGSAPEQAAEVFQKLYTRRTKESVDVAVKYLRQKYTGLKPTGLLLNVGDPDAVSPARITGAIRWETSSPDQSVYGVVQRGAPVTGPYVLDNREVSAVALVISDDQGGGFTYYLAAQRYHSNDTKVERVSGWTLNSVIHHWASYIGW